MIGIVHGNREDENDSLIYLDKALDQYKNIV
jgi:hypothetical protein